MTTTTSGSMEKVGVVLEVRNAQAYAQALEKATQVTKAFHDAINKPANLKIETGNVSSLFRKLSDEAASSGKRASDEFNKGFTSNTGGLLAGLNPLQTAISGFFLQMGASAAQAFANGLGDLTRFAVDQIKTGISESSDLQTSLADVASRVGRPADQLDELNKLVLELGADPNLVVNFAQAGESASALLDRGFNYDQVLGSLRQAILLQNSIGGTYSESAAILATVSKQFQIPVDELGGVVDKLVGLRRLGFSPQDLRLLLSQGGGVASGVGFNFNDFAELAGQTRFVASGGSDLGTSLKVLITSLIGKSDKAKDSLAELGLDFFAPDGSFVGGADTIKQIRDVFKALPDEKALDYGRVIFGTDSIRVVSALRMLTDEQIAQTQQTLKQANAAQAAAIRTKTLAAAWTTLGDKISSVRIGAFTSSLLPLERMTRTLPKLVDAFVPLVNLVGSRVATAFTYAADKLDDFTATVEKAIRSGKSLFTSLLSGFADLAGIKTIDLGDVVTFNTSALGQQFYAAINSITGGFQAGIQGIVHLSITPEKQTLNIGDFFTFNRDVNKTEIRVSDFFSFTNDGEKVSIKLADYITFDSTAEKTTLKITDYFQFTTLDSKITIKLGGNDFTVDFGELRQTIQTQLNELTVGYQTGGISGVFAEIRKDIESGVGTLTTALTIPQPIIDIIEPLIIPAVASLFIPTPVVGLIAPFITPESMQLEIPEPVTEFLSPVLSAEKVGPIQIPNPLVEFELPSVEVVGQTIGEIGSDLSILLLQGLGKALAIPDLGDTAGDLSTNVSAGIFDLMTGVIQGVDFSEIVNSAADTLTNGVTVVADSASFAGGAKVGASVGRFGVAVLGGILDTLVGVFDPENLGQFIGASGKLAYNVTAGAIGVVTGIFDALTSALADAIDSFADGTAGKELLALHQRFTNLGTTIYEGVSTPISEAFAKFQSEIDPVIQPITDTFNRIVETLTNFSSQIAELFNLSTPAWLQQLIDLFGSGATETSAPVDETGVNDVSSLNAGGSLQSVPVGRLFAQNANVPATFAPTTSTDRRVVNAQVQQNLATEQANFESATNQFREGWDNTTNWISSLFSGVPTTPEFGPQPQRQSLSQATAEMNALIDEKINAVTLPPLITADDVLNIINQQPVTATQNVTGEQNNDGGATSQQSQQNVTTSAVEVPTAFQTTVAKAANSFLSLALSAFSRVSPGLGGVVAGAPLLTVPAPRFFSQSVEKGAPAQPTYNPLAFDYQTLIDRPVNNSIGDVELLNAPTVADTSATFAQTITESAFDFGQTLGNAYNSALGLQTNQTAQQNDTFNEFERTRAARIVETGIGSDNGRFNENNAMVTSVVSPSYDAVSQPSYDVLSSASYLYEAANTVNTESLTAVSTTINNLNIAVTEGSNSIQQVFVSASENLTVSVETFNSAVTEGATNIEQSFATAGDTVSSGVNTFTSAITNMAANIGGAGNSLTQVLGALVAAIADAASRIGAAVGAINTSVVQQTVNQTSLVNNTSAVNAQNQTQNRVVNGQNTTVNQTRTSLVDTNVDRTQNNSAQSDSTVLQQQYFSRVNDTRENVSNKQVVYVTGDSVAPLLSVTNQQNNTQLVDYRSDTPSVTTNLGISPALTATLPLVIQSGRALFSFVQKLNQSAVESNQTTPPVQSVDGRSPLPSTAGVVDTQFADEQRRLQSESLNVTRESALATRENIDTQRTVASEIRSLIQSLPGVFSPTAVTATDVQLASEGKRVDAGDEWFRRLSAAVTNNSPEWQSTIGEARAALERVGIAASSDNKTLLEQTRQAYYSGSLFSNEENLSLINIQGVQAAIDQKFKETSGRENVLNYLSSQVSLPAGTTAAEAFASAGAPVPVTIATPVQVAGVAPTGTIANQFTQQLPIDGTMQLNPSAQIEATEAVNQGMTGAAEAATITGVSFEQVTPAVDEATGSFGGLTATITGVIEPLATAFNSLTESIVSAVTTINEEVAKLGSTAGTNTATETTTQTTTKSTNNATTTATTTTSTTKPAKPSMQSAAGGARNAGGKTLLGEFGRELIFHAGRGVAWFAGVNGPEIQDLPPGASVFTAQQTKEIERRSRLDAYHIMNSAASGVNNESIEKITGKEIEKLTFASAAGGVNNSSVEKITDYMTDSSLIMSSAAGGVNNESIEKFTRSSIYRSEIERATGNRFVMQSAAVGVNNDSGTMGSVTQFMKQSIPGSKMYERFVERYSGRVSPSATNVSTLVNTSQNDNRVSNTTNNFAVTSNRRVDDLQSQLAHMAALAG